MININIRLNNLFLINVISLYVTIHLSALVNALNMSLIAFREFHNLIRFIIDALIVAHVSVNVNFKNVDLN